MSKITPEMILAIARHSGRDYVLRGSFPTENGEIAYAKRGDKVFVSLSLHLNSKDTPVLPSDPASLKLSDLADGIRLPNGTAAWTSVELDLGDNKLYISTSYPCMLKKSDETICGYVEIKDNTIVFYAYVTHEPLLRLELPQIGEENQRSRAYSPERHSDDSTSTR